MWLALIVWVGGLIFFPVLAGTAFSVLPSPHLAGLVVRRCLIILHWMGIVSGIVFLGTSMLCARATSVFSARHLLVLLMLALTCVSQFEIIPRMDRLREVLGDVASAAINSPVRIQFDALHVWSTRIEGGVLLVGLLVAYLTARSSA